MTDVSAEQLKKLLRINSAYFNYLKLKSAKPCQSSYERQKLITKQPVEPQSEYYKEFNPKIYCKAKKIDPPKDYKEKTRMFQLESSNRGEYEDKTYHPLRRPQTACLPEKKNNIVVLHNPTTYQKQHDPKPHIDQPYQLKLDYPPTVMENLKMNSNSEYQRSYRCLTPEPDIVFGGKSMFSNPITPRLAMYGLSETHRLFRSMKIKQHKIIQPSLAKKLALDTSLTISNIPPFLGQYETVTKRDFSEKKIEEVPKRHI